MRPLGLEAGDDVPELAARLRIEAGGRLVEEEQLGIADQRAGDGEPLLLAAGELLDPGVALVLELDQLQHLVDGRARARRSERNRRSVSSTVSRSGRCVS